MNVSTQDLLLNISNSIRNKKPLSVVRCGDGEFHMIKTLNDFDQRSRKIHTHAVNDILCRNDIWKCKVHQLPNGKPTSCECYTNSQSAISWINKIRVHILDAIKNADYLGMHVPGKDIRFYGITQPILQRHGINYKSLKTVDSLFPRSTQFGSLVNFKNLIQSNGVHIITPNVKRFNDANFSKVLGVDVSYTDISNDRSYKQRDHIKESILKSNKKIFLFGGGGAIKDLIPWSAKTKGAVSIDVGSVLDAWAGYRSRLMYLQPEFQHLLWIK